MLVACVQETKLYVNSTLKEVTGCATIRRDRPTGGGSGGLVSLVHHSDPYRVPDDDLLPDDYMTEILAVETDLGGTTGSRVIDTRKIDPRKIDPGLLIRRNIDQWNIGPWKNNPT